MSRNSADRGRSEGRGKGRGQPVPFHHQDGGSGFRDDCGALRREDRGGGRGDHRLPQSGRGRGRGVPTRPEIEKQTELDRDVEQIENKSVAELKSKQPSETNLSRPGYGVAGKKVLLWANYFNLYSKNEVKLYRYSVTIMPDERGKVPAGKRAKMIIKLLLEEHFLSHEYNIATDFRSNLISRDELNLQNDRYIVTYRAKEEDVPAPNATQYHIRIQPTGSLALFELFNYLTSTQASLMFGFQDEIIQVLNIVFGHHPKAEPSVTTIAGNRHFSMNASARDIMDLGGGLRVIRGFFMSVRAATARVLVNVQVKNMAFYNGGPLDQVMNAFTSACPNKAALLTFVKDLSVNVIHDVRENDRGHRISKIYKVQGFATKDDGRNLENRPRVSRLGVGAKEVQFFLESSASASTSKLAPTAGRGGKKGKNGVRAGPAQPSTGRYISVFDFFKEAYNITIKDSNLPVVNVASKDNPYYLPAEVCEVIPGQPAKPSDLLKQQITRFAVREPFHNIQSIVTSGGRLLGFEPTNATLNTFDVNVPPRLITVPGRVLSVPTIKYSGAGLKRPRFGSWDIRSVKLATGGNLPSWTFLRISQQGARSPWETDQVFIAKLEELQNKLRELGISAQNYIPGTNITLNAQQIESRIDHCIHKIAVDPKRPKLVLVIIPEGQTSVYNHIKYTCDVKEGILSICVLDSRFSKANSQHLANIGLKFNLKLGGTNHSIEPEKLGFIAQTKTMVVGIDVTHPSPGFSSAAPSVAGIVASIDASLGQWPADIRVQPARQEMVTDLESMFKSRFLFWRERNKNIPENVLVYRDGVSESQYGIVLDKELPALRAACQAVYFAQDIKYGKPRITIIIVGKRHNTRFYSTEEEDADRGGNPMNGTVVDRGITKARNWDFFLQAHTAVQGTARPAHYYLPAQFSTAADALEDLTHNMCYLFGRATKAVSVCLPAYYADLVCTRARCYLKDLFDSPLSASPDTTSAGTVASRALDASAVTIHPNIRDAMFYI
ncbi:ribonuclease H-like domain-containing protein [Xylaria venustula]|nr:ribonuclease H-like domain-containing protein [Xylaria venustula]